jgi:L-amino acid N-acyltransferase YncA
MHCLKFIYDYQVYRIYRIDMRKIEGERLNSNPYILKLINSGDEKFIAQIECMEEWLRGRLKGKLDEGSVCLVLLDNETVVGFNLVSFGKVYLPLVRLWRTFRYDEAWSEQITVRKDYRQRGLGTLIRRGILNELIEKGYSKLYGGTLTSNEQNLRLARKVGFTEFIDIHYRKMLYAKKWVYKRVRPCSALAK